MVQLVLASWLSVALVSRSSPISGITASQLDDLETAIRQDILYWSDAAGVMPTKMHTKVPESNATLVSLLDLQSMQPTLFPLTSTHAPVSLGTAHSLPFTQVPLKHFVPTGSAPWYSVSTTTSPCIGEPCGQLTTSPAPVVVVISAPPENPVYAEAATTHASSGKRTTTSENKASPLSLCAKVPKGSQWLTAGYVAIMLIGVVLMSACCYMLCNNIGDIRSNLGETLSDICESIGECICLPVRRANSQVRNAAGWDN